MKAYILNLERSAKRRDSIVAEANRIGLDYEIVPAIDGGAVPIEDLHKLADMEAVNTYPDWLSPRVLATQLSHRRAYERILEDGLDYGIVLEDDARLTKILKTVALSAFENLHDGEVALLHFGSPSRSPITLSKAGKVELELGYGLYLPMTVEDLGSAAAYIVTKKAAKQLVDGLLPLHTSADTWNVFVYSGMIDRLRMVYPMPASISGEKSTISIDTQTSLRARLTEIIDKYRVPLLNAIIQRLRLWVIERQSTIIFSDEPSPFHISEEKT
jgi:glycosyl transferase family 25